MLNELLGMRGKAFVVVNVSSRYSPGGTENNHGTLKHNLG